MKRQRGNQYLNCPTCNGTDFKYEEYQYSPWWKIILLGHYISAVGFIFPDKKRVTKICAQCGYFSHEEIGVAGNF